MAIVSTGQITLVDNNDARTVVAAIAASLGTQQTYTKDDTTESFAPNYASTNNVLAPSITISSPTAPINAISKQKAQLSSVSWSTTPDGTPNIVNAGSLLNSTDYDYNSTTLALSLKTNKLTRAAPSLTLYFSCNYTDPATSLVTQVLAQITLGMVVTGTNALYVVVEGPDTIPMSDTAARNNVLLTARLMRGSSEETTLADAAYKWYKLDVNGSPVELNAAHPDWHATEARFQKFRFLDEGNAAVIPPASGYHTGKKIRIFEDAVRGTATYRVDILDDTPNSNPYSKYFTVTDKSDAVQVIVSSDGGTVLQNGQGSKTLRASMTKNGAPFAPDGWTYRWNFRDKDGKPAAFVDAAKIFSSTCKLKSNTANSSGTATVEVQVPAGGSIPGMVADSIVKLVTSTGVAGYYLVNTAVNAISNAGSAVDQSIVIKQFSSGWPITGVKANLYQDGQIFACVQTLTGAQNVITGNDIDSAGTISVGADKPAYTA